MRQRKVGIVLDGARQMFRSDPQRGWLIAEALAQTGHEGVVRLWVAAVPVARLRRGRRKPTVQRFEDEASDFVLNVEDVIEHEVMLLGKRNLVRRPAEQPYRT